VAVDGGEVDEPYRKSSGWKCERWLFYTLAFGGIIHILLVWAYDGTEGLYILCLEIRVRLFGMHGSFYIALARHMVAELFVERFGTCLWTYILMFTTNTIIAYFVQRPSLRLWCRWCRCRLLWLRYRPGEKDVALSS
jgi:hypothetical protein